MGKIIELDKDTRKILIDEIKGYFLKERDEKLGDLAAGNILNFFVEKLGVKIYNQGIYDAYKFMNDNVSDILGLQK